MSSQFDCQNKKQNVDPEMLKEFTQKEKNKENGLQFYFQMAFIKCNLQLC